MSQNKVAALIRTTGRFKWPLALAAACLVAACGGGDSGANLDVQGFRAVPSYHRAAV